MTLLSEAICVEDGTAQRLPYHQRRMNAARRALFGKHDEIALSAVLAVPPSAQTGTVKARVIYGAEVQKIEFAAYQRLTPRTVKLVDGGDIDYAFKYADRSALDALKSQRGHCDDIVIVKHGWLTDSSSGNIVLWDGDGWWTPSTPLLSGTRRAALIDLGQVRVAELRPSELRNFSRLSIVNAMNDLGRISIDIANVVW